MTEETSMAEAGTQPGSMVSNTAVRIQLAAFGDDGTEPRHVLHYAYPEPGNDLATRPAMIAELESRGFEVSDAAAENGLVFEHHRSVAAHDFDEFTEELSAYFKGKGWFYDGWECAVVGIEIPHD